jgi:hypothetical protein
VIPPLSALRRCRTFVISVCNLVGLGCSLAGVWLLFWYALPNAVPGAPQPLTGGGPSPQWEAEQRAYNEYSHIGLVLVIAGTLLEAVPPFCTARGSWLTSKFEDPPMAALPGNGLAAGDAGTQSASTFQNVLLVGVLALALVSRVWQRRRAVDAVDIEGMADIGVA